LAENIATGVSGRTASADDLDLLGWVGLSKRTISATTGGDNAPLARAVIMSPEVILADEPTGNVDGRCRSGCCRWVNMGKIILIAT
jgi:cell division transport system ATP-binding protein